MAVKNEFAIYSHNHAGAGWLVEHRINGGETLDRLAFRTLDSARKYVASIVKVNKRVRFTKQSDTHYTYIG